MISITVMPIAFPHFPIKEIITKYNKIKSEQASDLRHYVSYKNYHYFVIFNILLFLTKTLAHYEIVLEMFTRMFVSFNEKILQHLLEASNQLFQNFKSNGKTADKQLKYFMHEYKKVSYLEKLYLFPKIDKALCNVPG